MRLSRRRSPLVAARGPFPPPDGTVPACRSVSRPRPRPRRRWPRRPSPVAAIAPLDAIPQPRGKRWHHPGLMLAEWRSRPRCTRSRGSSGLARGPRRGSPIGTRASCRRSRALAHGHPDARDWKDLGEPRSVRDEAPSRLDIVHRRRRHGHTASWPRAIRDRLHGPRAVSRCTRQAAHDATPTCRERGRFRCAATVAAKANPIERWVALDATAVHGPSPRDVAVVDRAAAPLVGHGMSGDGSPHAHGPR